MQGFDSFSSASAESLGIPSRAVLRFIEKVEQEGINIHGFLLLRHGKIAAEGYWAPYSADKFHRMYSISKSFVSLAIGLLIDEGKVSLDDRVASFFKDKVQGPIHPYLAQATIRHLLMMASPHARTTYTHHDQNFVATFFQKEPTHRPGALFSYDTSATVVLCTLVEIISELPFLDYMRDKLLDPIGFSKEAWCIKTPEGTSWGGSGMLCTLRDMAKVAYICMNHGRWNGLQLISEQYIQAATSKQIDNSLSGNEGYGYQIWRERNNGFSFRGMGSQFALCFPDEGLLFACIADTQRDGSTGEIMLKSAFWEKIYSQIKEQPLPVDESLQKELAQKLASLKIPPQQGKLTSSRVEKVNGKWYRLDQNPLNMSRLRFIFRGDEAVWEFENDVGLNQLTMGFGKHCQETFPRANVFGDQIGVANRSGYDCLASGAWVEEHKLNVLIHITDDYLGMVSMSFSFHEHNIAIHTVKAAEWFLDGYAGFASGTFV